MLSRPPARSPQAHLELATVDLGLAGARYHGILDDDMGVVTGYRTYNFTKIDASWDYQVRECGQI